MCGIAGVISKSREKTLTSINRMNATQAHRGPDASHTYISQSGTSFVGLGHRRLSIIDLSDRGKQPMINTKTGSVLCFNGEIYNYKSIRNELKAEGFNFFSSSDTEVLLYAMECWGESALTKIEGMYAFAFFCPKNRNLFLARDPLGIKPLYFGVGEQGFCFSSELRAIQSTGMVRTAISQEAVSGLLAFGSVPEPQTLLEDVHCLEPGCYMNIDVNEPVQVTSNAQKQFWSFPSPDTAYIKSNNIKYEIENAVASHLISDVPVSVLLSGGIDSTLLAAYAAKASNASIDAITVGYESSLGRDEVNDAAEVADYLGMKHHVVRVSEHCAKENFYQWLHASDQPSVDGLNTFTVAKEIKRLGHKVALTGLGGDELFAGYSTFDNVLRFQQLNKMFSVISKKYQKQLANIVFKNPQVKYQKLKELLLSDNSICAIYLRCRQLFSDQQLSLSGLGQMPTKTTKFISSLVLPALSEMEDKIAVLSILETCFYMRNTLLRDADVCSMAHGVEMRVPLLDQALVMRAFSMPGRIRKSFWKEKKHILRDASRSLLPKSVFKRKKRGFTLPVAKWLSASMRNEVHSLVFQTAESGVVDKACCSQVWQSFIKHPNQNTAPRVLVLAALGNWLQKSKLYNGISGQKNTRIKYRETFAA